MNTELVKQILSKSIELSEAHKTTDPWNHGIQADIEDIKDCCNLLQANGYIEGVWFGDGYSEPDPVKVRYISVLSDHNICFGRVTEKGRSLLESLLFQEQVDSSQSN